MNLNKLPCVNTLLLNRYLKDLDKQAAYDSAIAHAEWEAQAAPVTNDDLYEFGCQLEMGGPEADAIRDKLAALLTALNDSEYVRAPYAELVGFALIGLVNRNRAARAAHRIRTSV